MATPHDILKAMKEAKYLFEHGRNMTKAQRDAAILQLSEYEVFTIGQLGQITGLSTSALYAIEGLKTPRTGSGKFNPLSLDTLIQMRVASINDVTMPIELIRIAEQEGNSRRVVSRLTGVPTSTITRKVYGYHSTRVQRAGSDG